MDYSKTEQSDQQTSYYSTANQLNKQRGTELAKSFSNGNSAFDQHDDK